MRRALLMFAKNPVPGKVKTRLQPPLTPEQSAMLYRTMVEDLVAALIDCNDWDLTIMFAPSTEEKSIRSWLGSGVALVPQSGLDLGERLESAFSWCAGGGYDQTVIIGSDMPDLEATDVTEAFERLATADVVLGPARDGGYYLVGLKRPTPELFRGIEWSTPRVLEQTMAGIDAADMKCSLLAERTDVDTWEDAMELHSRLRANREAAPRTRAALHQLVRDYTPEGRR